MKKPKGKAFPVAEAARIDSEISSTAQKVFGAGRAATGDLEKLRGLIDRRAVLLSPPSQRQSAARLRGIQQRLEEGVRKLEA